MLKRGAVLPLVLGLLLAITLLLTSLLQSPGGIRRLALRNERNLQQIYNEESSLLLDLEGLGSPDWKDVFMRSPWNLSLPAVRQGWLGPWADFSSDRVHVLAGIFCDSTCLMLQSSKVRRQIYEGYKEELNGEIMRVKPPMEIQTKSGNRRISGPAQSMALRVLEGDLSLDLAGSASSVRAIAEGNLEVRGSASFDTLRLYSKGLLTLRGDIKAPWLEAFSEDRVEISQNVNFSGVVVSRRGILLQGHATARHPVFMMALEGESPKLDSMLIPPFVEGEWHPFEWSLR